VLPNLSHLINGRPSPGVDRQLFVEDVAVIERERRQPRVERMILICWILIAIKHVAIIWVCQHYAVPFHQLWVNFPTWLLGTLATAIYYRRIWRDTRRQVN
jgi:hypothetical protein